MPLWAANSDTTEGAQQFKSLARNLFQDNGMAESVFLKHKSSSL